MKYWWLEKYQKLEIKMLPDLFLDIRYFLRMPKNYLDIYNDTKNIEVLELKEFELLVNLYVLVSSKNIKNNRLILIIERLLKIPDTSLPVSDYSLKEILDEVKGLKENFPIKEKMDYNNVAACYNCMQIFYVDYINAINKRDLCLCPYCGKHYLYFDNDYIPMNTSFIKLASLYYGTSSLGCKFKDIQKILKKNISLTMSNVITTNTVIKSNRRKTKAKIVYVSNLYSNLKKINSISESKIIKEYYDSIMAIDNMMEYEITLVIEKVPLEMVSQISFLIVLAIMEALSKTLYLRNIKVVCSDLNMYQSLKICLKEIEKY